jgi:hypothetical protein
MAAVTSSDKDIALATLEEIRAMRREARAQLDMLRAPPRGDWTVRDQVSAAQRGTAVTLAQWNGTDNPKPNARLLDWVSADSIARPLTVRVICRPDPGQEPAGGHPNVGYRINYGIGGFAFDIEGMVHIAGTLHVVTAESCRLDVFNFSKTQPNEVGGAIAVSTLAPAGLIHETPRILVGGQSVDLDVPSWCQQFQLIQPAATVGFTTITFLDRNNVVIAAMLNAAAQGLATWFTIPRTAARIRFTNGFANPGTYCVSWMVQS